MILINYSFFLLVLPVIIFICRCIFYILSIFQVEKEAYVESDKIKFFEDFGLDHQLINVLERYDITTPLKIQVDGIPKIMNGSNTVITAETGCGKTLSYLIPMINKILIWKKLKQKVYNSPLGLIVTPTRELAFQIGVCTIYFSYYLNKINYIYICACFEKTYFTA